MKTKTKTITMKRQRWIEPEGVVEGEQDGAQGTQRGFKGGGTGGG